MSRHSSFARALWLFAIAVLAVRVGDAHLHLCGDGKEQPIALHVADAPGQHHADEDESTHKDRDLDISGPTLFKKVAGLDDLSLAPVLASALVLFLPIVRRIEPPSSTTLVVLTPLFALRPPLRGPPR
jgi:hypothetical protein